MPSRSSSAGNVDVCLLRNGSGGLGSTVSPLMASPRAAVPQVCKWKGTSVVLGRLHWSWLVGSTCASPRAGRGQLHRSSSQPRCWRAPCKACACSADVPLSSKVLITISILDCERMRSGYNSGPASFPSLVPSQPFRALSEARSLRSMLGNLKGTLIRLVAHVNALKLVPICQTKKE